MRNKFVWLSVILAIALIYVMLFVPSYRHKGNSNTQNTNTPEHVLYNSQRNDVVVFCTEDKLKSIINSLLSANNFNIDSSHTSEGVTTTVAHNLYPDGRKVVLFAIYSKVVDSSYLVTSVAATYGSIGQSCDEGERDLMDQAGKAIADAIEEQSKAD